MKEVFASFDDQPFASASIGQTYHARLHNGDQVVVKVQHQNVQEVVRTDLSLFDRAIHFLNVMSTGKSAINIAHSYQELRASLLNEIDTEIEIKNGTEFYRLNDNDGIIQVPKVYREYSAQGLLVNQAMPGTSIKNYLKQPVANSKPNATTLPRNWYATLSSRSLPTTIFTPTRTPATCFFIAYQLNSRRNSR